MTPPPTHDFSPGASAAESSVPQFTASIVTYRNPLPALRRAVESVLGSAAKGQLMLVDNADEPAVASLAQELGVQYVRAPRNVGFGGGHNLAYAQLRSLSPFHLLLNPDVRFGAEVIPALLARLRAEPDLGVIMPKILYADGSTQYLCKRLPTPWDLVMRRFAPAFARRSLERATRRYELRDHNYDAPMEPPTLSGCCLLLRNAVVDRVGLFDERFFLYMEDFDLVRRIWTVARALYDPEVAVVHDYQKGSYRSTRLAGHHVLSAVRYFSKWGWIRDPERDRLNRRIDA